MLHKEPHGIAERRPAKSRVVEPNNFPIFKP